MRFYLMNPATRWISVNPTPNWNSKCNRYRPGATCGFNSTSPPATAYIRHCSTCVLHANWMLPEANGFPLVNYGILVKERGVTRIIAWRHVWTAPKPLKKIRPKWRLSPTSSRRLVAYSALSLSPAWPRLSYLYALIWSQSRKKINTVPPKKLDWEIWGRIDWYCNRVRVTG